MPHKPPHRCSNPGCPERITEGRDGLPHKKLTYKILDKNRPNSYRRGYNKRWSKIRNIFLSKQPLCIDCEDEGITTPATEAHHIIPISKGGTHTEENLMALCKSCHSKRTGRERGE